MRGVSFLERQDSARRRTRVFLVQFVLLAIPCIAAMFLVMLFLIAPMVNSVILGPFLSDNALGDAVTNTVFAIVTSTIYTLGLFVWMVVKKRHQLSRSGDYVAGELGARRLTRSRTEPNEYRLRNIAEEMALAAGIPAPSIYVWPDSDIVNSLTIGHNTADAAIFVSSGAVEVLDRDEMQALVGHGMSQILNGDMALNIKLASYLYAFKFAPRVANALLTSWQDERGYEKFKAFLAWLFFLLWLGLAVAIVSIPQYLAARVLQASVSRERQKLADASALQFTRNPQGVKGLLLKAMALGTVPTEGGAVFDDLAHGCFGATLHQSWMKTHPPLEARVRAVDPRFLKSQIGAARAEIVKLRERAQTARLEEAQRDAGRQQRQEQLHELAEATTAAVLAAALTPAASPAVVTQAGADKLLPLAAAGDVRTQLLALLLDRKRMVALRQVEALRQTFDAPSIDVLAAAHEKLPGALPAERSLALDKLFPDVRVLATADLRRLLAAISLIERADTEVDVFEYTFARLASTLISDVLAPREPHGARHLAHRATAVHSLLRVLAQRGANSNAAAAYEAGMRKLGLQDWPKYAPPVKWLASLDAALAELDGLQPIAKEMLLEAVDATVKFDRNVTPAERELLRVVAGVLHCPMPRAEGAAH
jgi:Zn-dependent protease with chaperone function